LLERDIRFLGIGSFSALSFLSTKAEETHTSTAASM